MRSAASRIALATTLMIAAFGAANARIAGPEEAPTGPAGDYPMVLGAPFIVDGVTYTPADTLNYDSVGHAQTGDGEGVSGAHRTLPLPSYVEVTSLESGRTILVRLTQRGPMTGGDVISLSPGAWTQLGAPAGKRLPVRVRRVNPPEAERALLRSGANAPARMDTPPGLLAALNRKLGTVAPVAAHMPESAAPALSQKTSETPPHGRELPRTIGKAAEKSASKPAPAAKVMPGSAPAKAPPPTPATAEATAPAKPSVKAPASAAAKGESKVFHVQVGAYSTRARAETVAKAAGGSVAASGKLWRVRTGPHKDRGQADAALAKVRAAGYADARVVTAP